METQTTNKIYRYLESIHVESFFSRGELRLSSYQKCRHHEDLTRRDESEGVYHRNLQGQRVDAWLAYYSGDNSYLLCTSIHQNAALLKRFGVDSLFRIDDVSGFQLAITQSLSRSFINVADVRSGRVQYPEQKRENIQIDDTPMLKIINSQFAAIQDASAANGSETMNKHQDQLNNELIQYQDDISLFAKPKIFKIEQEYRLVWGTTAPATDGLTVHCPEAIQFCSRVDPSSLPTLPLLD